MAKAERKSQKSLADRESSLQPVSKEEPISDRDPNLVQEANEAKILLESSDQEYTNSEIKFVYVVSSKWLTGWKQYTSYDNVTQGKSPDEKYFGQDILPKINQDIVVRNDHIIKYIDEYDCRNVVLREGIEEKKDYELITETAWNYFAERYEHITVKRPVHALPDGNKVVDSRYGSRIIQFKGNYLEKDSSLTLGEISLSDEDIIFLDSREQSREWTFFGDGADIITKCDYCATVQKLNISCDGCNKVHFMKFIESLICRFTTAVRNVKSRIGGFMPIDVDNREKYI